MNLRRDTDLTLGPDAVNICTELRNEDTPSIETRVQVRGEVVFRTETNVGEFTPVSEHSEEISHWMDAQHQTILARLQEGSLGFETMEYEGTAAFQARLQSALSRFATRDFTDAARELRDIAEQSPEVPEVRHLLEAVHAAQSGEAKEVDSTARLRMGAEAFAAGNTRRAVEFWKACLAKDPSNRMHQLLVLLSTTESAPRRASYAQELIAVGGQLLTEGHPEEAHALLLVAQTVEQSSLANQNQPASPEALVAESMAPVEEPQAHSEKQAIPRPTGAASSDTNPRTAAVEDFVSMASFSQPVGEGQESVLGRIIDSASQLPSKVLYAGAAALILLAAFISPSFVGGNRVPAELLDEASMLLSAGEYNQATDAYSKILADWDDLAPAHLGRARARLALGDLKGGLDDLSRAVELEPDAPASAAELADVLYVRGQWEEAALFYQRAIDAGSTDAEARYRLASSLVQLNRPDEALAHLEAAIAVNPSHGEARLLFGTLLSSNGRYAEAERELRAARPHIDPGGDYFVELGYSLLQQAKLEGAEEVAREYVRSEPRDARSHTLLGEVYRRQKQYEPARGELIRALELNSSEPRAQVALGRTWLAIGSARGDRGDLAKARRILESAQGVPEGERLLVLGEVALAEGKVHETIVVLEQSLRQEADEVPVRLLLAEARFRVKDYAGAATELERARGLSPSDPAIPLSLALVYSRLKEPARASEEYLKAIQGVGGGSTMTESQSVALPSPYIPLPGRFDVNRAIRSAYRQALAQNEEDPHAMALKTLAESSSFVLAKRG
jgi:tetratricopeptide (TPR) repeat protein